jgi:Cu+-exporting ATPase
LKDNGVKEGFGKSVDLNETEGYSLIFVARNGQCVGWVGLQDQTRPEARESLAGLKDTGVRRIAMVTGDRQPVAARVAREIGCEEVVAECLPQNKVEFVRDIKTRGYRVAVVGDGVNDAPALAAAEVGIAMGTGTDVAIESAGITLLKGDLTGIVRARRLSQATMRNIRQNLFFAFIYNAAGVPIAAGVLYPLFGILLSPIIAAAAMALSSVSVVGNSLRLRRTAL